MCTKPASLYRQKTAAFYTCSQSLYPYSSLNLLLKYKATKKVQQFLYPAVLQTVIVNIY
ncbi:hypothetical protein MuYL_0250 [Mucilaginibacter xinganensis]|uniref:Uncharacterized protein n=1 Tax=Mucilaginibacter xinganensis TaxID=1234841 RepID=A0A223NQL2_9SPHI|nr:hypothetical protein MuYL_0250 [Mucilaginibacter xinganensis]